MFGNPSLHLSLCRPPESECQVPSALTNSPGYSIRRRQLTSWVIAESKQCLLRNRHSITIEWTNVVLMTLMVGMVDSCLGYSGGKIQLMWREKSCCSTMTHGLSSQHKVPVCFAFCGSKVMVNWQGGRQHGGRQDRHDSALITNFSMSLGTNSHGFAKYRGAFPPQNSIILKLDCCHWAWCPNDNHSWKGVDPRQGRVPNHWIWGNTTSQDWLPWPPGSRPWD